MTVDVRPMVNAYFSAINEERYEDVAALFHRDGELRAPGISPTRGRAALAEYFRAALRPYPEHLDTPTRTIVAGSTATVEVHFGGSLESGSRVEFEAVDVFDFDAEGWIVSLSSWYDSHAVRAALRVARAQPAES